MQVAYYPPAGFIQDARNAENEGRRLITFRDDLGHANFDGNPCYLETAEAVTWTDSADHSIKFLTLCSSFYTWPERYEKADVDEEADNLDHWTRTQAALLLHERECLCRSSRRLLCPLLTSIILSDAPALPGR